MTDNKIIKALECCNGWDGRCLNCPLNREGTNCKEKLNSYTLDLINRQKAENDSLKVDLAKCSIRLDNLYKTADEIKSKAIKEFAERLKEKASRGFWNELAYADVDDIDNLVKEMTE